MTPRLSAWWRRLERMFEELVGRLHGFRASIVAGFEQVAEEGGTAGIGDLEEVLINGREMQRALQALELETLAHIGRLEEKVTPRGVEVAVRPIGHVDDHAAAAVAVALGISTGSAAHRLGLGARLASRLTRVLRLLAHGSIELGATAHTSMTFTSHDASLDFASEGSPVRDFATACTPTTIAGADCWVSGVEVPKVGYIPPEAVAALLSDADLNVGRALLEADAGVLREACSAAYRPTAAMRKFVQARDVTCRMFGCSRAVIRCDLDHGKAWPAGDTRCTNLCGLCRRHHRTKQQRRWSFSMTSNGECTWTAPTGAKRSTYPPAMAPEHPPSPPSVPPSPRRTSYDDSDPPPF